MKRIMLDAPDMVDFIGVTYVYRDTETFQLMVGMSTITYSENRNVIEGKEPYILGHKKDEEEENDAE